jgi:uncharacterized protein YdhG (YjbR/CyaY superfamily)
MPKFTSVDDYLASLPREQRDVVEKIEQRVLTVAPSAERVVRYDMPTWQIMGPLSSTLRRGSITSRCTPCPPG